MEKTKAVEILSPVGNKEMLVAAVRCGADAVYLGAKEFNARRNADNFGELDLKQAIEYCHIRGVKVFLTLNIILSDDELADAFDLAKTAYNYGVDAVIAADIGFINLMHKHLPELPIHASTQMTVHSPSAIPFLKNLGIKRVVLARELDENTIKEITLAAHSEGIEVEVFVHGALCMSVSGQCLLSSMLGGRSGNRGLCAGPCRLPFAATGGKGYDLSLKDLSLIKHIKRLHEIGVDSFKIEGRMKRPEYVAAATAALRQALYGTNADMPLEAMLNSVFSRSGFTDGYFTGKTGRDMFGIRTKDDVLTAADVLPSIHALYRNERQSVALSGKIVIKGEIPIELTLDDGHNSVTLSGPVPEKAINRSIDADTVIKAISKLGGTPFFLEGLDCHIDDELSVSMSSLNNLRRECVEELCAARGKTKHNSKHSVPTIKNGEIRNVSPKLFCRFDSIEQIPKACHDITLFSLPADCDITSVNLPENAEKWIELPRWMKSETLLTRRIEAFKQRGFVGAVCSNIAQLDIVRRAGLRISANFSLNIYNTQAAAYLEAVGCEWLLLSPEIQLSGAKKINCATRKGIIAYGHLPLMVTINCPVKNGMNCKQCSRKQGLTDRKGIVFPVRCRDGYSELLNSRPIHLADRMNELNGLDFVTLYFTDESEDEVTQIINDYSHGTSPTGEYTRGLYYRSVE